ncbi:MAG: elongation factor G [Chloroflexi bacterium]|nr:elongation factor G [Chloroflexota bacterium]MBV9601051.1 elongation factor G [Chloroflexota bacterium]
MKEYAPPQLRNVGLFSHGGAGKTTLSEALLFRAGAISRMGSIEDGNTTTDFDPDELRRQMSVSLSVAPLEWQGHKVNLLDTPGYADFYGEVAEAARVSDGALILIDGVAGPQVGTDAVWKRTAHLPRLIVVNKLDRENADYRTTLDSLRERYGKSVVPLTFPIGKADGLSGVIDLLEGKAYMAGQTSAADPPAAEQGTIDQLREMLVESACELDDNLINKYLEGEELSTEELVNAIRQGVREQKLFPVLATSGGRSIGLDPLLNAIVQLLPSPADVEVKVSEGENLDVNDKLAALVFKTVSDPNIGRLSYVRVYSGTLTADSHVWNSQKSKDERIGQVFHVRGKSQEPTQRLVTGDIGVIPKLSETVTGDTLAVRDRGVEIAGFEYPPAAYFASVHPKSRNDVDKLSTAMARLLEEDPSLQMHRETSTNEVILSGLGDSHLEVAVQRLQRKFGVNVTLDVPKVAYRETITGKGTAEGRHVRQSGGHGQYGVVNLEIEPTSRGEGFEFVDKIVGGVVPRQFIPAVEKGVRETLEQGVIAGYPVVDVRCALVFGKYHPVDSSEAAFKTAGSVGFKAAFTAANPVLLEPVMHVEVTVPSEFAGDIMGDLNTRRAHIHGMTPDGPNTVIEASVPQSEMLRYATDLRSMTQGRGTYTMRVSHYDPVPAHLQQKIIEEHKREVEA